MRGIKEKRLKEIIELNEKFPTYSAEEINIIKALKRSCEDLDPWIPIKESPVDTKERIFITKSGKQRVDRFHPSQHATDSTDLRWQERPGDRYTHFKELSEVLEK
jgi:hypothetical protein